MPRRSALLVAVDDYQHLPPLKLSRQDVDALEKTLRDPALGAFDEVKLLLNPSLVELKKSLSWLVNGRQKDDSILFYFSGHGQQDGFGELYFALGDTDGADLMGTGYEATGLKSAFDKSASRRQLILLDCCYSGVLAASKDGAKSIDATRLRGTFDPTGYGRDILTASAPLETAFEDPSLGLSVFTHKLVDGLRGGVGVGPDSEYISVEQLYQYVHREVKASDYPMTPHRATDRQSGEHYIARNPQYSPIAKHLRDDLCDQLVHRRKAAVGELAKLVRGKDLRKAGQARELLQARLVPEAERDFEVRDLIGPALAEQRPPDVATGGGVTPTPVRQPQPDTTSQTKAAPAKGSDGPSPRKSPWLLGLLLIAVISVGIWWVLQPQPKPPSVLAQPLQSEPVQPVEPKETPAERAAREASELAEKEALAEQQKKNRELAALQSKLREQLNGQHYTSSPTGGTALQTVKAIEKRSPGAESARDARQKMAAYYEDETRDWLKRGKFDDAETKRQLGEQVLPGDSRWPRLKAEIAEAKREAIRLAAEAEAKRKAAEAAAKKKEEERLAALPAQQAAKPALPKVQNIDGAKASVVKDLQKRTAAALGKPVVYRDTLKSGGQGPEMVVIPAGQFTMGSPASEPGRDDDEGPQHRVTISKPFALGKTEVTFADYDRFAEATGRDKPKDRGWGRGDRPVINVSWGDAQAYAEWLSEQTGHRYRLPTEAEWEYAARAGTQTAFSWGEKLSTDQANYSGRWTVDEDRVGEYRGRTVPVESFAPNTWGLYQMHGNVWELCADWKGDYPAKPVTDSEDGLASGSERVLRGGSWFESGQWLRSAYRYAAVPGGRFRNAGFRLAGG